MRKDESDDSEVGKDNELSCVIGIGVDLTGILGGGRMVGLTIKALL